MHRKSGKGEQNGNKELDEQEELRYFEMNVEKNRLESFKDWPFKENCSCTPEKMAEAGFFHCPSSQNPDLVMCFVCLKELDGWEPTDDPWEEHKSHSAKCPYLSLENPREMTVKDFIKLECARQTNRLNKAIEEKVQEFEEYAKQAREEMEKLA